MRTGSRHNKKEPSNHRGDTNNTHDGKEKHDEYYRDAEETQRTNSQNIKNNMTNTTNAKTNNA